MKVQVERENDKGETIKGADDKPVMEEQTVTEQNIVQGPMASQVAIKMLGTNGGGYANANAAQPFENPTPLSNFIQMLVDLLDRQRASLITLAAWSKTRSTAGRFGLRCSTLFIAGVLLCWWQSEAAGNPIHHSTRRGCG